MNEIAIINKSNLLGKEIDVYGTFEEPLFLAKDVAEWIEHSNTVVMIQSVDEDEKVAYTNINNVYGGQKAWFLTEDEDEKLTSIILRAGQNHQIINKAI